MHPGIGGSSSASSPRSKSSTPSEGSSRGRQRPSFKAAAAPTPVPVRTGGGDTTARAPWACPSGPSCPPSPKPSSSPHSHSAAPAAAAASSSSIGAQGPALTWPRAGLGLGKRAGDSARTAGFVCEGCTLLALWLSVRAVRDRHEIWQGAYLVLHAFKVLVVRVHEAANTGTRCGYRYRCWCWCWCWYRCWSAGMRRC